MVISGTLVPFVCGVSYLICNLFSCIIHCVMLGGVFLFSLVDFHVCIVLFYAGLTPLFVFRGIALAAIFPDFFLSVYFTQNPTVI